MTDGSPLQSLPVTYTRDRCAYVVDLTLYTVERTAFGRQGPEVRILSPRPISSLVFIDLAVGKPTYRSHESSLCTLEISVASESVTIATMKPTLLRAACRVLTEKRG